VLRSPLARVHPLHDGEALFILAGYLIPVMIDSGCLTSTGLRDAACLCTMQDKTMMPGIGQLASCKAGMADTNMKSRSQQIDPSPQHVCRLTLVLRMTYHEVSTSEQEHGGMVLSRKAIRRCSLGSPEEGKAPNRSA